MEFKHKIGADDSMVEFVKMTILLAFHEYPINNEDNDYERAHLVKEKFNEKYGNYWSAAFIIRGKGNIDSSYNTYYIKVHYNGYVISIWKHK